jgi:hypothetical protein
MHEEKEMRKRGEGEGEESARTHIVIALGGVRGGTVGVR